METKTGVKDSKGNVVGYARHKHIVFKTDYDYKCDICDSKFGVHIHVSFDCPNCDQEYNEAHEMIVSDEQLQILRRCRSVKTNFLCELEDK